MPWVAGAVVVAVGAEQVAAAAQLVARAPALLGYDPDTLAVKMRTLRHYLIGCDVAAMVRRQPSLLLRDLDASVPLKLKILLDQFDDEDEDEDEEGSDGGARGARGGGGSETVARIVERHPALLFTAAEQLLSRVDDLAVLLRPDPPAVGPRTMRKMRKMCRLMEARSKTLARTILSKAPSLFSYRLDTIASTMQQWHGLLFPASFDVVGIVGVAIAVVFGIAELSGSGGGSSVGA